MRKRGILFRLSLFRVIVMLSWYSSLFRISDFEFPYSFGICLAFRIWYFGMAFESVVVSLSDIHYTDFQNGGGGATLGVLGRRRQSQITESRRHPRL